MATIICYVEGGLQNYKAPLVAARTIAFAKQTLNVETIRIKLVDGGEGFLDCKGLAESTIAASSNVVIITNCPYIIEDADPGMVFIDSKEGWKPMVFRKRRTKNSKKLMRYYIKNAGKETIWDRD